MQIIILPGNNISNQTWGELVRDYYGPQFTSVHLVEYEHWVTGAPAIDFDVELVKLREREQPLFTDEPTVVVAKSAGALLAFVAVEEGVLQPSASIFFGIPFAMAAEDIFKDDWTAVSNFSIPGLAFHNRQDPTADYRYTQAVLAEYAPQIKLITTAGDDHWYGDFSEYDEAIQHALTTNVAI